MNGLTRITDRIAVDAEREAADMVAHARADAHEKYLHYQGAAEEKRGHILALGSAKAQELVHRSSGAAELDARKTVLGAKQELVSETFEEALAQLCGLPPEVYGAFLVRLAVKASITGTEEIILNETDGTLHGMSLVNEANRLIGSTGKPAGLTLSAETRPIAGGLILKNGPVECNCSLEVLVKLARNTLVGDVAKVLFGS